MADLNKEIDVEKVKNQTIKLTKDSNNKLTFKNDIVGQVTYKELNGKLAVLVYDTDSVKYSYTKVVEEYVKLSDSQYRLTSTKYVLNNNKEWMKSGNSSTRTVDKQEVPPLVTDEKKYWVEYVMNSKTKTSTSSSTSSYALADADSKDEFYKVTKIDKYGFEKKSVTENIKATIYLDKGNIASKMVIGGTNFADVDLLTQTYYAQRSGDKYTGTYLNNVADSSDGDEIFSLKEGNDLISLPFFFGKSSIGNDVINVVKGENLTIQLMNSTSNEGDAPDDTAEKYVDIGYSKQGNDLVLRFSDYRNISLGQTTLKNYFKLAQDNITIKYSGVSSSVIDYTYNLKDVLECIDGIGFIGDESAETAQKLTGNFLDNVIFGGQGDDIIKGVSGDNIIFGDKGSDKIYSGKDSDAFIVYEGDATGNGDFVYNANSSDELYFYNDDGSTSDNTTLTKNGKNLIVNYGGADTTEDDKVTFVNYFKKNTDIFNINDDESIISKGIIQTGKENKANKLADTKYNDLITGGNKNDTYTFTNGGKDAVTDAKGNDTYKVKSLANSLTITDNAGKDKLIVSDKNGYNLYFEVSRNGKSVSGVGKDLQIFDKTKMEDKKIAGGVTVKNYIAEYQAGSEVTKGDGCIETIKVGGKSVSIDVNSIANSVAGWLSTTDYASTTAVFETGNETDITAMLNVYMTGKTS